MPQYSKQITEFFGVFFAYTEIIEKSRLFGKCPFHWNYERNRIAVDFEFVPYYKFWIKICIIFISSIIPTILIFRGYFNNKFYGVDSLQENVPFWVISIYTACIILAIGIAVIILPMIILWDRFATSEIERSFKMFLTLSEVHPKSDNGCEISVKINKIATFTAHLYLKLTIIVTIIFVTFDMDPLHYLLPRWTRSVAIVLLRLILFLISVTEICRLVVIAIFFALFAINALKREIQMWIDIARRSNLGGMHFYRQIAILYTYRIRWATMILTIIVTVGFMLQVGYYENSEEFIYANIYLINNISLFTILMNNSVLATPPKTA
ncbi:hypothetical protein Fcan01_23813 [Folsomia candida]|uniref:Uncharacterized protein n=1 Tax=Folsomia candida TaxID=158441 RepID=A0A226D9W2_FOLCA|nr:hypothetical protein Fcan01_23813 [Folsomia candida]